MPTDAPEIAHRGALVEAERPNCRDSILERPAGPTRLAAGVLGCNEWIPKRVDQGPAGTGVTC